MEPDTTLLTAGSSTGLRYDRSRRDIVGVLKKLDGRYRAGRTVAFKLGTGQLVAVWETARVISDAVRDYCAKGGLPAKTAVFHNDIGDGVEELKWTADATGEGVTVYYKLEQVSGP